MLGLMTGNAAGFGVEGVDIDCIALYGVGMGKNMHLYRACLGLGIGEYRGTLVNWALGVIWLRKSGWPAMRMKRSMC